MRLPIPDTEDPVLMTLLGVRASIYNAITEGDVERLVDYIEEFIQAEKDARA